LFQNVKASPAFGQAVDAAASGKKDLSASSQPAAQDPVVDDWYTQRQNAQNGSGGRRHVTDYGTGSANSGSANGGSANGDGSVNGGSINGGGQGLRQQPGAGRQNAAVPGNRTRTRTS
jgi:hypothetical protein